MVMASPTNSVTRMQAMILKERTASHSVASTASIIAPPISQARSASVANSSSDSGTGPVRRTRTPLSWLKCSSAAAARIASVALAPGSSAPKSSLGCTSMKRRSSRGSAGLPLTSVRQEKNGLPPPATFSSVSPNAVTGRAMSASLACPCETPSRAVCRLVMMPRSEGSDAIGPRNGAAAIICSVLVLTSARERNSKPLRLKKSPPSGRRTTENSLVWPASFAVSDAAPDSASSGVAPSITTRIRLTCCGNRESKWISRCRQSTLGEINLVESVSMLKFSAV